MIRIAHIGAFNGRNSGDTAIRDACHQLLDPAIWTTFDCQSTVFGDREIERLNEKDLVVIGGGGLFWDRPGNNSRSGWQWDIGTEDLAKITTPIVVLACGWTQFPYIDQTDRHPEIRNSLRALQEQAALFSVRNEGTRNRLDVLGLDGTAIEVVPDVAYALEPTPGPPQKAGLALCWAHDKPDWRWLSMKEHNRLRKAMDGYSVSVIDHLEQSFTGQRLVDWYSQWSLVFGMRKHSLIVPLAAGVPVIGLGHMAEVRWILEDVGLGDWLWTERTPKKQRADMVTLALAGGQPKPDLPAIRARLWDFAARARRVAGVLV